LILEWVNHVDLFRIKGVGEEYSDLLEEAGVDTVPELAQRNPENLYQKLVAVNQEKRLVRQLPNPGPSKRLDRTGQAAASCCHLLGQRFERNSYYWDAASQLHLKE
jgi:predicted flap endonuclease-1-like 5' DNA nuclease